MVSHNNNVPVQSFLWPVLYSPYSPSIHLRRSLSCPARLRCYLQSVCVTLWSCQSRPSSPYTFPALDQACSASQTDSLIATHLNQAAESLTSPIKIPRHIPTLSSRPRGIKYRRPSKIHYMRSIPPLINPTSSSGLFSYHENQESH